MTPLDTDHALAVEAAELDGADPLAEFRLRFLEPDGEPVVAYLDGNSLGRPLVATAERLAEFTAGPWGNRLIRAWDEQWMDEPTRLGDRLGEVVLGAGPGQTIVADSTSVMIYKFVRAALDAQSGRNEIVIDRENFPTDRFIVEGIAAERGATIRWIEPDSATGVTPADVEAALSPRTAVVLLSHVAYRSGFVADAQAITDAVHRAGALMVWDLCHSAGSVRLELDAWGVDLAVGCTYKYLNGGPGSPAFGYVRRDLQDRLIQPIWGWMGAADPFGMTAAYTPASGIRRFITGTPPILAMQPLAGMVELLAEAGMEAVRAKSVLLTEFASTLSDRLLAPLGVEFASPRDAAQRGSHITINHPRFREVTANLWERGVIPDFRPPHGLRLGLSPLSTSFAEVLAGVEAVRDTLAELA
ncbi:aminotransferase class V-fold PLP-dependent enzyme [Sinomonas sp. JGH33]|uniref:Kynureninase n=1 Tax=Sinomonas terricola TaxID=3110330 RepID=A0ABU5TCZ9_9MICC|nr:aminotransferase class V-fold PLP-dependent enzyme [Sinomonas sp. JGH33]MEA5457364.1 aminotransferase class V-fold PLP-dependent enzyme [Sinomonas sp. JGH33]